MAIRRGETQTKEEEAQLRANHEKFRRRTRIQMAMLSGEEGMLADLGGAFDSAQAAVPDGLRPIAPARRVVSAVPRPRTPEPKRSKMNKLLDGL